MLGIQQYKYMTQVQIQKGQTILSDVDLGIFSFDDWLYLQLYNLGTNPDRTCCTDKRLYIKDGNIVRKVADSNVDLPKGSLFNMDKWLKSFLLSLGVVSQRDLDNACCLTKKSTFLKRGFLRFSKKKNPLNVDLRKRVLFLLDKWDINYADPCCDESQEFFVFTYDFHDPSNANTVYANLATVDCDTDYTYPGRQFSSNTFIVNGTSYISSPQLYTLDDTTLTDVAKYYDALAVPGATYRWVAVDTGWYQELYKNTTHFSNVAYLVVKLPKNSTVVSTFTFNPPTIYSFNTEILNPSKIFNDNNSDCIS